MHTIRERYLAGEPLSTLAADAGVSIGALAGRLYRDGLPARSRLRRERALAELPALIAAGATTAELAACFDVSASAIRRWAHLLALTPARPSPARPAATLPADAVRRYVEERTAAATIARELGISERALRRRLGRAGIRRPPRPIPACPHCGGTVSSRRVRSCRRCRRRYPSPTPRVCELDGCDVVFTPQPVKVARGAGRFHSYECWNRWRTGRPQREWRSADADRRTR